MRTRTILGGVPALLAGALAACHATPGVKSPGDSTVQLHTPVGLELGVATDYGVVFLGRGARSGSIQFTTWFPDGPSVEEGVIEPVGPGLYTTEAEILLPAVPVSFREPPEGTRVSVRGRDEDGPYSIAAYVARDPHVEGILLRTSSALDDLGDDQIGAGVYVPEDGVLTLLGLISGKLSIKTDEGWRTYVTVVGPRELWRLVTHQRNRDRPRRWVHRPDIE